MSGPILNSVSDLRPIGTRWEEINPPFETGTDYHWRRVVWEVTDHELSLTAPYTHAPQVWCEIVRLAEPVEYLEPDDPRVKGKQHGD